MACWQPGTLTKGSEATQTRHPLFPLVCFHLVLRILTLASLIAAIQIQRRTRPKMIQLIASLSIDESEPEALQKYFETANPLIERYGGRVVSKFDVGQSIVGKKPSELLMLVEYPSRASVDALFNSEEYKSIIPFRDTAFRVYNICLVEPSGVSVKIGVSDIAIPLGAD